MFLQTERLILLYLCGTDIESDLSGGTRNLMQVLNASFSKDKKIRFLVLTGGPNQWNMDMSNLCDELGNPVIRIEPKINQLWECYGADAEDERYRSKMVLLNDQSGTDPDVLMTKESTLLKFLDYGYDHYPAKKYQIIFWDHGGGPQY